MNTLDFLREFQRICVSYGDCDGCPLCNNCILETPMYTPHMPEEELTQFINGVENWSRNHPIRIFARNFFVYSECLHFVHLCRLFVGFFNEVF